MLDGIKKRGAKLERERDDPINQTEMRDGPVIAMEDTVAAMSDAEKREQGLCIKNVNKTFKVPKASSKDNSGYLH